MARATRGLKEADCVAQIWHQMAQLLNRCANARYGIVAASHGEARCSEIKENRVGSRHTNRSKRIRNGGKVAAHRIRRIANRRRRRVSCLNSGATYSARVAHRVFDRSVRVKLRFRLLKVSGRGPIQM